MTSTNQEPMTQITQAAGGYSASGSFLVPGGGLFIKNRSWPGWACAVSGWE